MARRRIFPVDMEAHFREPNEEEFALYPEPVERPGRLILDPELDKRDMKYVKGLNQFVDDLNKHILSSQEEETKAMQAFNTELKKQNNTRDSNQKGKGEMRDEAKINYQQSISGLRKSRRTYKEMMKDAINERQKFLDSYRLSLDLLEEYYAKSRRLKLTDASTRSPYSYGKEFNAFFGVLISFQIFMYLIAFAIYTFADSADGNNGYVRRADDWYSYFTHILIIVVFGFGYLSVFLKRYMFGAAALNFLVTAFAFQWALTNLVLWKNVRYNPTSFLRYPLTIEILIETAYVAGGVSISLGALIGKITAVEMILVAFWEVIFFVINQYVVVEVLGIVDPGGAIYIHTFGAFFALGASWLISAPYADLLYYSSDSGRRYLSNSYFGDFFALIATVFVWALLPSWNAALAPDGTQYRVIINSLISLSASAVVAAIASRTLRGRSYHVKDVQFATLAGGIGIASAHAAIISPGAAMIVGSVSGFVSVGGFIFARRWLEQKSPIKLLDTRGVFILHGISGIIGGIGGIIACGGTSNSNFYGQPSSQIFPRTLPGQGAFQGAGLLITLAISLLSGLVAGLIIYYMRLIIPSHTEQTLFSDKREFHVPVGYPELEFDEP